MTSVKSVFFGKRVLLLQGPVGPFFWNLAQDMRRAGAEVFKFNFNAGDWLFYPRKAHSFKGHLDEWQPALQDFLLKHHIDVVMLFGDCRPLHASVRELGQRMGFAVGVFEEGYLRPDHVTFEPIGVNGHSQFRQGLLQWLQSQVLLDTAVGPGGSAAAWEQDVPVADQLPGEPKEALETPQRAPHQRVGNTYWHGALWGMLYFFAAWLGQFFWNNALHHRLLTIRDAPWWWLSYGRKAWFKWAQKGVQARLEGELHQRFFLVPLQVHNDAQITVHSDYESVCGFIDHVMRSFAGALRRERDPSKRLPDGAASVQGDVLVFKHHPMDRGHRDYTRAVRLLTQRHGLQGKVFYIHDQHLPSLLKAAKGVVLVNSTTGLSALGHGAPVKVCGSALYDMPGLTFQGRLQDFWFQARSAVPDPMMLQRFKTALLARTQLNGSFYRKLPGVPWQCGVWLQGQMAERLWPKPVVVPVSRPPVEASPARRRNGRRSVPGKVSIP